MSRLPRRDRPLYWRRRDDEPQYLGDVLSQAFVRLMPFGFVGAIMIGVHLREPVSLKGWGIAAGVALVLTIFWNSLLAREDL